MSESAVSKFLGKVEKVRGALGARRIALALSTLVVAPFAVAALRTVRTELRSTRPPRSPVPAELPDFSPESASSVALKSADDLVLRGWFVRSRNGAAVAFIHGYGSNRAELVDEAKQLCASGYGVLLIDSRAHGESGGTLDSYGDKERLDVRAAVDFLSSQTDVEPGRVGLVGFSSGTVQVVLESAVDTRVAAVALLAPTSSIADYCDDEHGAWAWLKTPIALLTIQAQGIDVHALSNVQHVASLAPRPLLIVHASGDPVIPLRRAQQVFAAAAQPKHFFTVRGEYHGHYMAADPDGYPRALVAFFDGSLRGQAVRSTAAPRRPPSAAD